MKKIIITIAIAAFAPLIVSAQPYLITDAGITNSIAASASLSTTNDAGVGSAVIDLSRYNEVGFSFQGQGSGLSTNTITFGLRRSATSTNWENAVWNNFTVTALGTNAVVSLTNFVVGVHGYLQVYSITSACTNSVTNSILYFHVKGFRREG